MLDGAVLTLRWRRPVVAAQQLPQRISAAPDVAVRVVGVVFLFDDEPCGARGRGRGQDRRPGRDAIANRGVDLGRRCCQLFRMQCWHPIRMTLNEADHVDARGQGPEDIDLHVDAILLGLGGQEVKHIRAVARLELPAVVVIAKPEAGRCAGGAPSIKPRGEPGRSLGGGAKLAGNAGHHRIAAAEQAKLFEHHVELIGEAPVSDVGADRAQPKLIKGSAKLGDGERAVAGELDRGVSGGGNLPQHGDEVSLGLLAQRIELKRNVIRHPIVLADVPSPTPGEVVIRTAPYDDNSTRAPVRSDSRTASATSRSAMALAPDGKGVVSLRMQDANCATSPR